MKRFLMLTVALAIAASAYAADTPPKAAAGGGTKATTAAAKDKTMQQLDDMIAAAKIDKAKPNWKTAVPKWTPLTYEKGRTYYARMKTNKGEVLIKFLPETAPNHVTNFMYLTRLGFYDGLKFHRVITNFMAQGGDPLGNGMGGPGYKFDGEFSPAVKHDKGGLLSMANAGPGTDGSQFFLTFVPTPWLDGKHTIFGQVVEGMDVVKALEKAGSQGGQTTEPLSMEKVTLEVK